MYTIEVITNHKLLWKKQKYHWRIRVGKDIIATSENYYNFDDCYAVAYNLMLDLSNSKIVPL